LKIKWHAFIQKSIVALNDRCGGPMQSFLTDEYLNNEKLKDQYADNCLPLWNKFLSDVQNIARNMSTDSPKKYSSADVDASKSSLNAFAGTINQGSGDRKQSSSGSNELSDWVCKEKNCSKCIEQFIQDMILSNRSKKNNTSKKCPPSLLCTEHHEKHLAGTNITLENGEVKQRASHQKKKDVKSNAATSQGDGDDEDDDSKPGKRHKKNQKRKKRIKEAMALLKEKEAEKEAASDDKTPAASPKSSKPDVSADGSFDPNSLSVAQLGQCAKLIAGFQVVSTAEADTSPKDTTKASEESAPVSHGNVVKRLMGMFDSNQVDPSHIVANSSAANAACHMAGEVTLDGVYVPK